MSEPNETPQGKLAETLIKELEPITKRLNYWSRHYRSATLADISIMADAAHRCIARINRDVKPLDESIHIDLSRESYEQLVAFGTEMGLTPAELINYGITTVRRHFQAFQRGNPVLEVNGEGSAVGRIVIPFKGIVDAACSRIETDTENQDLTEMLEVEAPEPTFVQAMTCEDYEPEDDSGLDSQR